MDIEHLKAMALSMAVGSHCPGDSPGDVISRANEYLKFLMNNGSETKQ